MLLLLPIRTVGTASTNPCPAPPLPAGIVLLCPSSCCAPTARTMAQRAATRAPPPVLLSGPREGERGAQRGKALPDPTTGTPLIPHPLPGLSATPGHGAADGCCKAGAERSLPPEPRARAPSRGRSGSCATAPRHERAAGPPRAPPHPAARGGCRRGGTKSRRREWVQPSPRNPTR